MISKMMMMMMQNIAFSFSFCGARMDVVNVDDAMHCQDTRKSGNERWNGDDTWIFRDSKMNEESGMDSLDSATMAAIVTDIIVSKR